MLRNIGNLYATSHKRLFVPFVGGIRLLCDVLAVGPVSFVKRLQMSPTGQLIPLNGCVNFCERFVARGMEF